MRSNKVDLESTGFTGIFTEMLTDEYSNFRRFSN